jgi:hypothetical protein
MIFLKLMRFEFNDLLPETQPDESDLFISLCIKKCFGKGDKRSYRFETHGACRSWCTDMNRNLNLSERAKCFVQSQKHLFVFGDCIGHETYRYASHMLLRSRAGRPLFDSLRRQRLQALDAQA